VGRTSFPNTTTRRAVVPTWIRTPAACFPRLSDAEKKQLLLYVWSLYTIIPAMRDSPLDRLVVGGILILGGLLMIACNRQIEDWLDSLPWWMTSYPRGKAGRVILITVGGVLVIAGIANAINAFVHP
jgi:hypothetical protein